MHFFDFWPNYLSVAVYCDSNFGGTLLYSREDRNYSFEYLKYANFSEKKLDFFQFSVGEEEGFGALGVEVDLDFVVLGNLIAIDTKDRTKAKDAMGYSIIGLPFR